MKLKLADMASTLCVHFICLVYRTRNVETLFEIFNQHCRMLNLQ